MTPSKLKMLHLTLRRFAFLPSFTALFLLLLLLPACSSSRLRREATVHVLERQNELLESVKSERRAAVLVNKVQADSKLKSAEEHLLQAIRALQDSNRAVQRAL
mgnify:CR=1 FL=1